MFYDSGNEVAQARYLGYNQWCPEGEMKTSFWNRVPIETAATGSGKPRKEGHGDHKVAGREPTRQEVAIQEVTGQVK